MEKDLKSWVDSSRYDLDTARAMLQSKRYLYVLFTCQQAIEKILKALIVKNRGNYPPRLHNLTRLAERSGVRMTVEKRRFLEKLNYYYIQSRYPEEQNKLGKEITHSLAADCLRKTRELWKWLNQKLELTRE